MNKKLLIGILSFMVVSFIITRPASSAITGSKHDFSHGSAPANWSISDQICIVCHTPHNANVSPDDVAPLWNHTVTSASFETYSSPSLQATVTQPNPASKACLSCHDGTVAVDAFGGSTTGGNIYISGDANLGTDLSNDHPISFTYDDTLASNDGGLYNPTSKTVGPLSGQSIAASMLIDNKLECSSCHDVHRSKGDSETAGSLLLVSNTGSALCLTCHNK